MELRDQTTTKEGRKFDRIYSDNDPRETLKGKVPRGVFALCFHGDKLVIVYEGAKKIWNLPSGSIEPGETYQEATVREVKEESNMKVLHQEYIGCIAYIPIEGGEIVHMYSICTVEPYGDFVMDPDGDVTSIQLIDPKDISNYVPSWNAIEREIMRKALELKT